MEKLNLGNLNIFQLGYVYKDAEKQAKVMESVWGMPPFAFMENTSAINYRGKEVFYTAKLGFSRFFNKQIELIQPLSGESSHKEFLDSGREGLQHISCIVEGLDSYIEEFEKQRFKIIQSGNIGKQHFAYFDTEDALGIILELQETVKRRKK